MNLLRRFAVLAAISFTLLIVAHVAAPGIRPSSEAFVQPASAADTALAGDREILGRSGNLRALIGTASALEKYAALAPVLAGISALAPGVHSIGRMSPDRESLVVVSLEAFGPSNSAQLAGYRVGQWPSGGLTTRDARYSPPSGFIAVTRENASTLVSKHFRLRDFLTHDQQDVWPKVLVLQVDLLDKLELVAARLKSRGMHASLHIMSGFRTPQYNAQGVGSKGGRASASRHIYGDAADVFVDEDGDGCMDDLDGDGRITIADARLLLAVAEDVETSHPDLVGGLSAYAATAAHGPFVHIDTRGTRARW